MPDALSFDANDVAPRTAFDVIPDGWYRAWITDSEVKPNNKGTGEYLQLVWEILDGDQKGRKVWDRLNVKNANETAQEIARASLSAICHAIGVMRIQHTGQLHGKPCLIKVTVKPGQPKKNLDGSVMKDDAGNVVCYEPSNEVKGYKAEGGAAPAKTPARATVTAPGARAAALEDVEDDLPF